MQTIATAQSSTIDLPCHMTVDFFFLLIYVYYSLHEHMVEPRGSQAQAKQKRKTGTSSEGERETESWRKAEAAVRTVKVGGKQAIQLRLRKARDSERKVTITLKPEKVPKKIEGEGARCSRGDGQQLSYIHSSEMVFIQHRCTYCL
jgi:hypothetical protein